jgi:protein-S-isoprenylcysteine O-methyltransferase Ste14
MRTVAVISMLFLGWLLVLGACIEITRAVMAGYQAGHFYHLLAAILCGTAALLILARLRPNIKAVLGLVFLAVAMALSIFVPARTFDYWQGWTYLAIFLAALSLTTIYLMKNDPALLQRRLRSGLMAEHFGVQRIIWLFTSIGFIALLVVPAFDHRFGWSNVPRYAVIVGNVLVAAGNYIVFLVFKENTFAAATIQIESGQRVIATGPYGIVRHPMYGGALIMLLGTPLALGSYWGLLAFAATMPFLIWRLFDEERYLAGNLPGYAGYQQRVRWRLIPGVL